MDRTILLDRYGLFATWHSGSSQQRNTRRDLFELDARGEAVTSSRRSRTSTVI
jgi:hypothetical protein